MKMSSASWRRAFILFAVKGPTVYQRRANRRLIISWNADVHHPGEAPMDIGWLSCVNSGGLGYAAASSNVADGLFASKIRPRAAGRYADKAVTRGYVYLRTTELMHASSQ